MQNIQRDFKLKRFILFSMPITLQALLRNLVGFTDNFMVGVLGPEHMAALKISTTYFFFFTVILVSFSNAGAIIAGQMWGKQDHAAYKRVCATTLSLAALIGAVFSLFLFFGRQPAVSFMINDEEVIRYAVQYLAIMAGTFFLTGINIALSISFTAQGDTKSPFYQQIIITIINILLNYLLIFGNLGFPRMEVVGAALSSFISTVLGLVYLLVLAQRGKKLPKLIELFFPAKQSLQEIFHVGLPVLGDMFFWQFASMFYLKMIGSAGKEAMAVYGVVGIFMSMLFLSVSGFVSGTGICVSQLLGARDTEHARLFGLKAVRASAVISFFAGLLLILFSRQVPYIFKLEGQAYIHCVLCLIILGIRQPFGASNGVLSSIIRAGKDTQFPLYVSLFGFILVGAPLTLLSGPVLQMGIVAIFAAMSLEEVFKAALFFWRFKSGKWIKS